jgi:hypothetical protein
VGRRRHQLGARGEYDAVLCFNCSNFYCGPKTTQAQENASFADSPAAAALVRLAKEAFPDDKEIQGLKEE